MIRASGHTAAAALVADALSGAIVPIHPDPIPTKPLTGACAWIQTPQALEQLPIKGPGNDCSWSFAVSVLVIAADTTARDLLQAVDDVTDRLAAAGIQCTTSPQLYQTPNTPAAVPAVLVTGE